MCKMKIFSLPPPPVVGNLKKLRNLDEFTKFFFTDDDSAFPCFDHSEFSGFNDSVTKLTSTTSPGLSNPQKPHQQKLETQTKPKPMNTEIENNFPPQGHN